MLKLIFLDTWESVEKLSKYIGLWCTDSSIAFFIDYYQEPTMQLQCLVLLLYIARTITDQKSENISKLMKFFLSVNSEVDLTENVSPLVRENHIMKVRNN